MFRNGLPYGWWKSPDLWAIVLVGIPTLLLCTFIVLEWWL